MIIDFHTHIFPDSIADRAISALRASSKYDNAIGGKQSDLIDEMNKSGVDFSVNLPILTNINHFDRTLEKLAKENEEQQRIISFACIHPLLDNIDDKLKQIKDLGFKGVKLHPFFQNFVLDDLASEKLLEKTSKNDLICVIHTGTDASYPNIEVASPDRIIKVFKDVDPQKVVLAHMGALGYENEVLDKLCELNAYFDCSFCVDTIDMEIFKAIVKKHGDDKMLFGTDSPWKSQTQYIKEMKKFNFSEQTYNKIMFENAKKLLKI